MNKPLTEYREYKPFPFSGICINTVQDLPKEQLLTVMMVDLVNSTALSNELSSREIGYLLLEYYAICSKEISRNEGRVIRCIGDGVLAIFEDTISPEACTKNAMKCAIKLKSHITEELVNLTPKLKTLSFRISIVTGYGIPTFLTQFNQEVVFGKLPFIADRLNHAGNSNDIIFNCQAAKWIAPDIEISKVENLELKGFKENIEAWRLC